MASRSTRISKSILAIVAVMIGVVGCSTPRKTIVLKVASWGDPVSNNKFVGTINQIYHKFELAHPGVKIEREVVPDQYVSKMVLDHAAGDQADILMLDGSSAALFINDHLVRNLRPQIASDSSFHLSNFYKASLAIADRGSAVYAIPQDFTPMVVYYDKSKFAQYHVPLPRPNWNFKQFLAIARAVNHPPHCWGIVLSSEMSKWIMWLWNNGGDVINLKTGRAYGVLNSPANIKTFKFLSDLVNKYKVAPSPSAVEGLGIDLFANGDAAMTVSGHWSLVSYLQSPIDPKTGKPGLNWKNLGVAPMPHNVPQSQTVLYESGFAESAECRHARLAWQFIKYMTSYPVQMIYNQSGIAIDARKDVAKARATTRLEREFLAAIPGGRAPYGSIMNNYSLVEPIGQSAFEAVITNGVPPQKALSSAAKQIDRELRIP